VYNCMNSNVGWYGSCAYRVSISMLAAAVTVGRQNVVVWTLILQSLSFMSILRRPPHRCITGVVTAFFSCWIGTVMIIIIIVIVIVINSTYSPRGSNGCNRDRSLFHYSWQSIS
jgi:hypothetical protein